MLIALNNEVSVNSISTARCCEIIKDEKKRKKNRYSLRLFNEKELTLRPNLR